MSKKVKNKTKNKHVFYRVRCLEYFTFRYSRREVLFAVEIALLFVVVGQGTVVLL